MKFKYWIFKINLKDYSMQLIFIYSYIPIHEYFLALPIRAYILKKYEILPIINYMTLDFKLY